MAFSGRGLIFKGLANPFLFAMVHSTWCPGGATLENKPTAGLGWDPFGDVILKRRPMTSAAKNEAGSFFEG